MVLSTGDMMSWELDINAFFVRQISLRCTCPGNPTWKLLRVSWCVLVKSGEVMGKSCKVVPPQLELGYPINYRILYIYPTKTIVKLDTHFNQRSDLAHWGTPWGILTDFPLVPPGVPCCAEANQGWNCGHRPLTTGSTHKKNAIETEKMD